MSNLTSDTKSVPDLACAGPVAFLWSGGGGGGGREGGGLGGRRKFVVARDPEKRGARSICFLCYVVNPALHEVCVAAGMHAMRPTDYSRPIDYSGLNSIAVTLHFKLIMMARSNASHCVDIPPAVPNPRPLIPATP